MLLALILLFSTTQQTILSDTRTVNQITRRSNTISDKSHPATSDSATSDSATSGYYSSSATNNTHLKLTEEPPEHPTNNPVLLGGWGNVSTLENIPANLVDNPLQIKTGRTGSSGGEINIDFNFVGGGQRNLVVKLIDKPTVDIEGCNTSISVTDTDFLKPMSVITWTILKTNISLMIKVETNTILDYYFSSSTSTLCSQAWNGTATSILFTTSDTASQEYRGRPVNCTALPRYWQHIVTDTLFPVPQDTVIQLRCSSGYWNIGDISVLCNTNMYTDFKVQKEPWCLGINTIGSEVLAGTKTTLTCTLDNIPPAGGFQIAWSVNGNKTTNGVEIGQEMAGNLTSTITVESPTEMDHYVCHLAELVGVGKPVTLNIFSMRDVSKDVQVGMRTVLGCFVENISGIPFRPKITWKNGDVVISSNKDYKINIASTSHTLESFLTVDNPTEDVNFTCQVTSGKFPNSPAGSKVVSLNTFSVSNKCSDYCLRNQKGAVVECSIQDTQAPMRIRWFKQYTEISGALESFQDNSQKSVLFIQTEGVPDEQYTCQIESRLRPESGPTSTFVSLPSLNKQRTVSPLTSSPVVWVLAGVLLLLTVVVAVLGFKVLTAQRSMVKLSLRLSTREKLDSCHERPVTIHRNRATNETRDIESLRRTLDRRPPTSPAMSQIDDDSVFKS